MPAHDLVVIGFDSGEVQIYQGLDETGKASPEPGKIPIHNIVEMFVVYFEQQMGAGSVCWPKQITNVIYFFHVLLGSPIFH